MSINVFPSPTANKFPEEKIIPDQSGNSGKYLTTNGTTASWANLAFDPNPQIFMLMGA